MGVSVIGSFPGYIQVSDELGARRYDIGPAAWSALPDDAARWAANRHFLDTVLAARDTFVWAADPRSARPSSWLFREACCLRSKGVPFPTRQVWVS